ncbi:MAG TPA: exo-beta-N-acetylmuramidase NamZ domain-containing protein [Pyrinomonadaceae bacterium]|nr:exo-beta-N-acetylmuramidase NamZ domain-containing protein [Pyrinomonadaceae bacterium]
MTLRKLKLLVALALLIACPIAAHPKSNKVPAGISTERLAEIDTVVQQSIEKKELPGAVVLVSHKDQVVWRKAYGARAVEPSREVMTTNTMFDLASLTKVVATATSIMILIERGQVGLNDLAVKFIPEMKGEGRETITIEQLLTHTAGFAPDFDLRERWVGYDEAMKRLYREPLRNPPGSRFVYSDIGYIALGEVVHRVSGQTLDEFARRNIFVPLGMRDTGFNPAARVLPRVAPTEKRRGQMSYLGDNATDAGAEGERWLRGQVHDPTSFRMAGVAGHAGLFSTADDLAIYCRMILHGGRLGPTRILSPMSVARMTSPQAVNDQGRARGLGWDIATTYSTNRGDLFPLGSFGHTGFTGTSLWLDPATDTFVVFLSNRVHPNGKGDVASLRGRVASIVAGAITSTTVDKARSQYVSAATAILSDLVRHRDAANRAAIDANVLTGIDVLEREGFKSLAGMRIGLVTNHTGQDRAGRSTIDVLFRAPGVKLTMLFSPEHGMRGLADENVSDTKDEKTGLPIYSLYGESRRPKPEQLKDLDAIVFDIQDIGARFYTYITTLGYVMEEAAKAKISVIVLDRPNPINGFDVEGPLADTDKLSFVVYHPLSVRHGMTTGELARFFNEERKIGANLRVIKMENWRRAMWFDSTGLMWRNPSPNMRSLTEATLYPGIGLLETTNLSVGRGTDTPFEVVGAPWLDGPKLASYLNARKIPGVRFVPIRFTPKASVFKNEDCGGINIVITDRVRLQSVAMGIEVAAALRHLYAAEWKIDNYLRLLANADVLERLKRGEAAETIVRSWAGPLEGFRRARSKALLYD